MTFVITSRPARENRAAVDRVTSVDVRDTTRLVLISDTALNDADKSFVITTILGAGKALEVDGIRVEFTATSDVATRLLTMEITDASDVIWTSRFDTDTDVVASADEAVELIAGGNPFVTGEDAGAAGDGPHKAPLPPGLIVGAGQTLRIRFINTQAGDDMIIHIRGREI